MNESPIAIGEVLAGRFEVVRELGRGAFGRVLLVEDTRKQRRCALKLLDASRQDDELAHGLLKEEFRVLRALSPHPNLVQAFEFGTLEDGSPYFTLEHAEGEDLRAATQAIFASGGPTRLGPRASSGLVNLLGQALRGLQHIHAQGYRHGDLKPEHIRVSRGTVKLIDLGLAARLAESEANLRGSLPYMAPELLRGATPDPRADLYALGVTLYEALTGSLPYPDEDLELEGGGLVQGPLARRLAEESPPSPRDKEPRIPVFLERVVIRLLQPRPEERYPTANRVIDDLNSNSPATISRGALAPSTAAPLEPRFCGRDEELAQAATALLGRRPTLVSVQGAPGIGKRRLVQEIAVACQLGGARAVSAAPSPAHDPFQPYRELLLALGRPLPGETTALDLSSPREALERRARIVHALASELMRPTTGDPVVLVLEEVHRFDRDAAAPLQALLARLERSRLPHGTPSLLVSFRDVEFACPELREDLERGLDRERGRPIALGPLALEACEELVRSSLVAQEQLSESGLQEVAAWVARKSEGHPYRAVELTKALAVSGILRGSAGELRKVLAEQELPSSLRELEEARLQHLTRRPRGLLSVLATFGRPVTLPLLLQACGTSVQAALSDLRELRAAGFVTQRQQDRTPVYTVAHEVLREVLYGGLRARRRKPLHDRVADALATCEAEAAEVALHRLRGMRPKESLEAALGAARSSEASAAFARARIIYEQVLEHLPGRDPRRVESLVSLAALEETGGELEKAHEHLSAARPEAQAGPQLARVLQRLARLADHGTGGDGHELLLQALAEVPEGSEAELRGDIYRCLTWSEVARGRLGQARRHCEQGLAACRTVRGLTTAQLRQAWGALEELEGRHEQALESYQESLSILRRCDNRTWLARLLVDLARVERLLCQFQQVDEHLHEALEVARTLGFPLEVAHALNVLGAVADRSGRYVEAERHYRAGLEELEGVSGTRTEGLLLSNLAYVLLKRGQAGEASDLLERARAIAEGRPSHEASVLQAQAAYALTIGDDLQAKRLLARARDLAGAKPSTGFRIEEARLEAERLARSGEIEPARERAQEILDLGDGDPRTREVCLEARLQLLWLCWREGPADEVAPEILAGLEGCLESARRFGHGHLEGEARLLKGIVLAHRGDVDTGEGEIEAACVALEKSGSRLDLLSGLRERAYALAARGAEAEHRRAVQATVELAREVGGALPAPLESLFLQRTDLAPLLSEVDRLRGAPAAPASGRLLEQIVAINDALNSPSAPRAVLERVLDAAIELVGAERGFILLKTERGLRVEVHRNIDREQLKRSSFKFSRSIAATALNEGRSLLTDDARIDTRFLAHSSVARLSLASVLCCPLRLNGQVEGVVYVDNRFLRGAFSVGDMHALEAFSAQAAIALRNARLLDELQQAQLETRRLNRQLEAALARERSDHDRTRARLERTQEELDLRYDYSEIAGRSPRMREVLGRLDIITDSDACVLITGETGTGKELLARALHHNSSQRREEPYLSVNCAAIPQSLRESILFGHRKGAFSGADADRKGLMVAAGGGTLFLDEVGELDLGTQAALLRALQEREVLPIGGHRSVPFRARLVAATNRNLRQSVREGTFREDLYYRLDVLHVHLPPLRERREDIPDLVEHLIRKIAKREVAVQNEVMDALTAYPWPGNVRELENELRRALIFARGAELTFNDLSESLLERPFTEHEVINKDTLKRAVRETERRVLTETLRRTNGNQSKAARMLGMSRYGFFKALKRLDISARGVH